MKYGLTSEAGRTGLVSFAFDVRGLGRGTIVVPGPTTFDLAKVGGYRAAINTARIRAELAIVAMLKRRNPETWQENGDPIPGRVETASVMIAEAQHGMRRMLGPEVSGALFFME